MQFFRETFSQKHDSGDFVRNILSHFPKLLDNFSGGYEQKSKIKKKDKSEFHH